MKTDTDLTCSSITVLAFACHYEPIPSHQSYLYALVWYTIKPNNKATLTNHFTPQRTENEFNVARSYMLCWQENPWCFSDGSAFFVIFFFASPAFLVLAIGNLICWLCILNYSDQFLFERCTTLMAKSVIYYT